MNVDAYRTPGVYVEQTRPVDAPTFSTGVPVFVGFVEDGYDLRLMSVAAADGLVNEGRNLVIVALVNTRLHIRIFDASGTKVVDKTENELVSEETLTALKEQLTPIPDGSDLSKEHKQKIIGDATSIAGHKAEALQKPRLLTRWEQFTPFVGHAHRRGFLDYAVRGFFENGGGRCVVVPLQMCGREPSAVLQHVFEDGGPLDDIEDVDLVCVPDAMMEPKAAYQVQRAVLEHCRRKRDRFAILDAVPIRGAGPNVRIDAAGMQTVIEHWQALLAGEGALYFPWLCVKRWPRSEYSQAAGRADHDAGVRTRDNGPTAGGIDVVAVPPCGHVAGIYARSDRRVGVHKAPANEIVEGVLDLETEVTDEDQGVLNEVGVNCLRRFSGRGIRVWGARTLSGQPGWRYVNVRRLFLTLTRWAERNLHEFVFEPNAAPLWERVRYRLASYCYGLFQQGALKGGEPAEAYYVKCDAETNPLEVREAGQLIAEVGLAAVAPAEFVIVHITQSNAQVSVSILVSP